MIGIYKLIKDRKATETFSEKPVPKERYQPLNFPVRIPFRSLVEDGKATICSKQSRIMIGAATCGKASGAVDLYEKLAGRDWEGKARVFRVGCLGACYAEPLVDIRKPDGYHYFYGRVDNQSFWRIIQTALGTPSRHSLWAVARERTTGVLHGFQDLEFIEVQNSGFGEFYRSQDRRISRRCGLVDPENIAEYAAMGGYSALEKALFHLKPRDIVDMIIASGLRGRGGAGFPTGEKWDITSRSPDPVRIVIANADEGDPGAYMDRALLESDPHSVLEGLMIAAYAVGASRAYIFIRHEYSLAAETLRKAISSANKVGLLGRDILTSSFSLEINLIESAGAFVCGEETSMIEVIENRRGDPRYRPPYPASRGLEEHPTLINNVETLANIPWIVLNGAEAFRESGTEKSPGTKIFCLAGEIERMGFIEVPLGTSTRALVEEIGGSREDSIKALQIGGPSGGIVPYHDFRLDYETVALSGAIMGSGGLVVLGRNTCIVDLARHLVSFMSRESCGKCVFCRDGLPELEAHLLDLCIGKAHAAGILEEIKELSRAIAEGSLCGLGKTASNPVLTTLKDYYSEYLAHTKGQCPVVSCKPLIDFEISLTRCRDCRGCYVVCPTGAVKMRSGHDERYIVDRQLCIKCRACYETCPFGCIKITSEEFRWQNS